MLTRTPINAAGSDTGGDIDVPDQPFCAFTEYDSFQAFLSLEIDPTKIVVAVGIQETGIPPLYCRVHQ